jgi:heme-degrading monooxygenase HmoA
MERVLIDIFIVPEPALPEFLEAARKLPPFLRSLPGFVDGWIYQKKEGPGRYNVVTTAVWASEAAYEAAKATAQEEYRRLGFNPQEVMNRLGVQIERGVFDRAPY